MKEPADLVLSIPADDSGKGIKAHDLYVSYNGQDRAPEPLPTGTVEVTLPLVREGVDAAAWVVAVYADGSYSKPIVLKPYDAVPTERFVGPIDTETAHDAE